MLVVSRFRVPDEEAQTFRSDLESALSVLSEQVGYADGQVGRNVDDPTLWVLSIRWENVGSYRRALSSYDVKLTAVPLLSRAVDEPSAYELVEDAAALNVAVPRSGSRSGPAASPADRD